MKRIIMLVAIILLLNGCSNTDVPSPVTDNAEPPHEYIPSIRCSNYLEEGFTVIASLDSERIADPVYVYIYANEPVYDVLVSELVERSDEEPVETYGALYVPELSAGQAIKLINPYPSLSNTENYYTRVALTNSADEFEAVLVSGDNENPSLLETQPGISGALYDEDYIGNEQFIISDLLSAEFREKTLAGEFDDCVPKGFLIAGGTLGDVNGDGIQDALMYLLSGGHRAVTYSGVMPLFVLSGQPDGKYSVAKKVPDALFAPYRSASYAVAGNNSIDIVHDYVGGAACHHTQVFRFNYLPDKNNWILGGFSYQPTYDLSYLDVLKPEFVRPLPNMLDLPLERMSGGEYYSRTPDWSYFDETCEFSSRDGKIYTLGIKSDITAGYYEGYIYMYYTSLESGGFIQTIRGELTDGKNPEVSASAENSAFTVNMDVWKMDEHDSDSFHLYKSALGHMP